MSSTQRGVERGRWSTKYARRRTRLFALLAVALLVAVGMVGVVGGVMAERSARLGYRCGADAPTPGPAPARPSSAPGCDAAWKA